MKYIKKYEYLTNHKFKPKLNDFVICKDKSEELQRFLSNNIGQIIDYNSLDKYDFSLQYKYIVKYNDIPKNLKEYFTNNIRGFKENEILHHSKNKEELEELIRN